MAEKSCRVPNLLEQEGNMKRPSRGFAVVEILIVLAVLVVLGAGVWVWRGQKIPAGVVRPSLSPGTTATPATVNQLPAIELGANCKEGRIAFVRNGNLWTIFPEGTGEQQLTEVKTIHGTGEPNPDYVEIPGDVANPAWSPDGCLIAFNDGEGSVWVLYTAVQHLAYPEDKDVKIYDLEWVTGAHERGILLVSFSVVRRQSEQPSYYLVGLTNINSEPWNPLLEWHSPIVKIEYTTNGWIYFLDQGGSLNRFKFTPASGELPLSPQILPVTPSTVVAAFDISGENKIVYTTVDEDRANLRGILYVIDAESLKEVSVIEYETAEKNIGLDPLELKVSPQGNRVAVAYVNPGPADAGFIKILDLQSKQVTLRLIPLYPEGWEKQGVPPWPAGFINPSRFSWGPDGNKLVVESNSYGGFDNKPFVPSALILVDLENNSFQTITTNASQPAWQP